MSEFDYSDICVDCPNRLIVQCKECKHRDPEDKKCDHGDMIHILHSFPMPDDWFCPLGQIKDGEQE